MTNVFPLKNFRCHAKIPESTTRGDPNAVRPDILAVCLICPHRFADHNIYCSQCPDKQHEFMVECGGPLKRVSLSAKKYRTTKCVKCKHIWMVRGDDPEATAEVCPRCGKVGPDAERYYHYSDCPSIFLPGIYIDELKRRMKKPFREVSK